MAPLARMTRSGMIEALDADYTRAARALGLSEWSVVLRHALRNALLPLLTMTAIVYGYLLGGVVLVENIFAWPGLGCYVFNAITSSDYPAVQGFILYATTVYVLLFLLVDVLYVVFDPRVQAGPMTSEAMAAGRPPPRPLPRPRGRGFPVRPSVGTGNSPPGWSGCGAGPGATRSRRSASPIVLTLAILGVLAPLIVPYDPTALNPDGGAQAAVGGPPLRHRHLRRGHLLARHRRHPPRLRDRPRRGRRRSARRLDRSAPSPASSAARSTRS